jgi:Plant transposon protein
MVMRMMPKPLLVFPLPCSTRILQASTKKYIEVDELIGSLDCTHTFWRNCPKAWARSFKGKE